MPKVIVEGDSSTELLSILGAIAGNVAEVALDKADEDYEKDIPEKDVPFSETYSKKQEDRQQNVYKEVTDLAEALKSALPPDLDAIREDICTAVVSINELKQSSRKAKEDIAYLVDNKVKGADTLKTTVADTEEEVAGLHESVRLIHEEIKRVNDSLRLAKDDVAYLINNRAKSGVGCKHEPAPITCDNADGLYNGNRSLWALKSWEGYLSDEDKKAGKTAAKNYYRLNGKASDLSIFLCKKCGNLYPVVEAKTEEETDPDLDSSCGP